LGRQSNLDASAGPAGGADPPSSQEHGIPFVLHRLAFYLADTLPQKTPFVNYNH